MNWTAFLSAFAGIISGIVLFIFIIWWTVYRDHNKEIEDKE